MQFIKMHGLGNDFVLVNCLASINLPVDLVKLAQQVCHRNFGIGADGLVLLWPSDTADLRMQILNPDGSEAEMCGNAIRCVAKYVYEHHIVQQEKINIETLAGMIVPQVIVAKGLVNTVQVDMGKPALQQSQIPLQMPTGSPTDRVINKSLAVEGQVFNITTVSMGNPHCVIFMPELDKVPIAQLGPKIEIHPVFPQKTNVEFVQVINRQEVRMQVWERGAGLTMACGTGACATVVAAVLNDLTGRKVTVHLAAGTLMIEWLNNQHVYMTGPAVEVFSGEFSL
ncbi:MAG: diaminopimelate epimerase [Desulfotomaculum sp.]|nr:diaminopimelate epimerase [Desulfotomaculum sp.]MCL0080646.1 diaminopimelate epimerase [Peptococcaceae bacterium]